MQFVITAYDGPNMLEKRMEVRPRHLQNLSRNPGRGWEDERFCDGDRFRHPGTAGRVSEIGTVYSGERVGGCEGRTHERGDPERGKSREVG